ncbi:MAG: hypothetical protein EOO60_08785 [Hymenobacter sp.]|nr:MAG: hypothetical protein EOO60_08785 [Hymenobacter sp.]
MPRRPAVTHEHLAQLLHQLAAVPAQKLGCTPAHVTVLLRRHVLTCAPASRGRRARTRLPPAPDPCLTLAAWARKSPTVAGGANICRECSIT